MGIAKILVVGAIQGKLKKAFEKISKLQAKQNFDLALIIGDVFGSTSDNDATADLSALLGGQINIPLATYYTTGSSPFPDPVQQKLEADEDVCPNLFFLGRKGTFTTTEGVKIVNLGGNLIQNEAQTAEAIGKCDSRYLDNDARGLHGANSAHILLTNEWPKNINHGSQIRLPEELKSQSSSQSVSNLCEALKPWYHFSSSPESLWEREPFEHVLEYHSLDQPSVTRFKSLPSVASPTKEWMTAFSLDTSRPPSTVGPPTKSPFQASSPSRKRPADEGNYQRYDRGGRHQGRHNKRARGNRFDSSDCFMCLNKSDFKTHMVVSIGEESMVTTQRGPLSTMSTFPQLSSSGHAMIIPHYHAADELAHGKRSVEEVANEFKEMNKFRMALSKMVGSKSQGQLGTVCWEVRRNGIRHHHWSLIACHADKIKNGLVEAAFKVAREQHGYPALENCDPESQLPSDSDYFRVWTWVSNPVEMADQTNGDATDDQNVGTSTSMFFPLSEDLKFNIWFGREVMAGLLKLEDRVNWMHALLRKDGSEQTAEEEDAEGLKRDFEDFDFAMK
ncbi:hypothetical protein PV10_06419 [Exophiala mesophila]|uniref:Cwf19-like C-terminal domain-containing protein n=1 Tax=Exophiala mesophila TaxID=212818 RepID=A0A0D1ZYJ4_EXOME|nr:uncharacterized protein PV10_06419 [Exophiala mesophila]KIV91933.1 hypothetical protein PV10_06419 [Exophiala mesophila]